MVDKIFGADFHPELAEVALNDGMLEHFLTRVQIDAKLVPEYVHATLGLMDEHARVVAQTPYQRGDFIAPEVAEFTQWQKKQEDEQPGAASSDNVLQAMRSKLRRLLQDDLTQVASPESERWQGNVTQHTPVYQLITEQQEALSGFFNAVMVRLQPLRQGDGTLTLDTLKAMVEGALEQQPQQSEMAQMALQEAARGMLRSFCAGVVMQEGKTQLWHEEIARDLAHSVRVHDAEPLDERELRSAYISVVLEDRLLQALKATASPYAVLVKQHLEGAEDQLNTELKRSFGTGKAGNFKTAALINDVRRAINPENGPPL